MYKKLIIGAVILVAVIVGMFVFISSNGDDDNSSTASELEILSFDGNKTSEIKVVNADGNFSFKYQNNKWVQTEGDEIELNKDKMAAILTAMSELNADKIISETAEKLEAYGLDKPIIVTAVLSDGRSYGLKIGKTNPTGDGYYVQKDGGDTIYLLASAKAQSIRAEKNDLKNTYILDIERSKDINYFKFVKGEDIVFDIAKNESGMWEMKEPLKNVQVNAAAVSGILDYFIRVTAEGFFTESPTESELKDYGLDDPQFIIEAATPEKSVKMYFGNYYDKDEIYIYAQYADSGQVAVFQSGLIGCLDKNTTDVLVSMIYEEKVVNLEGITFTINGEVHEFEITDYDTTTTDDATYVFNGKTLNDISGKELFASFFKGITGISFDNIDESAAPSGEPEISIVYHRNTEPDTVSIELYADPEDTSRLFISRDGEYTGFTMSRSTLEHPDGIQETFRKLKKYADSNLS